MKTIKKITELPSGNKILLMNENDNHRVAIMMITYKESAMIRTALSEKLNDTKFINEHMRLEHEQLKNKLSNLRYEAGLY